MENWKDVVGYEGEYRVSDHGKVMSVARIVPGRWGSLRVREKILKWGVGKSGYAHVGLTKDGKLKTIEVHKIVLEAFVGPAPDGMEACHWDNDRMNNCLDNLRWGTRFDNASDKIRHGSDPLGERNGRAVLSEADIPIIVRLCSGGEEQDAVSKRFGVSPITISHIMCGRTWSHVTGIALVEKRVKVDEAMIEKIRELKSSGMKLDDIAKALGISKPTAFRHGGKCKKGGVSTISGALSL
jgi:hypothetical protein